MKKALPLFMLVATAVAGWAQTASEVDNWSRLQGVWQPVRLERKGEFVDDQFLPSACVIIDNRTLRFRVDGKTLLEFHVAMPPRLPNAIDLTATCGPAKGQVLRGLFVLSGDRLMLCWPINVDAPRPAMILDAPDKDYATFTLQRVSAR